ncbi:MAG: CHAD domain-containing protein [Hyphomicrobiaceae bacterium]
MSYRLKFDEPMDEAWRRIAGEQLETALRLLTTASDRSGAIHETRKSMKRVRALLKLVRSGLSPKDYKRENKRFAGIARLLAGARDAEVIAATAHDLSQEAGPEARSAARALQSAAGRASQEAAGTARVEPHVKDAVRAIKRAMREIGGLKVAPAFGAVRRGLAKSYRAGRRGMQRAMADDHDEDFHEWRKAVQAHWRHMALMSRAWPDLFEARMTLAKEMSDLLGEDHDLYMLIEKAAPAVGAAKGAAAKGHQQLVRAARTRQREIREALAIKGAALFAEDTDEFVDRMEVYWAAARASRKLARKTAGRRKRSPGAATQAAAPQRLLLNGSGAKSEGSEAAGHGGGATKSARSSAAKRPGTAKSVKRPARAPATGRGRRST